MIDPGGYHIEPRNLRYKVKQYTVRQKMDMQNHGGYLLGKKPMNDTNIDYKDDSVHNDSDIYADLARKLDVYADEHAPGNSVSKS